MCACTFFLETVSKATAPAHVLSEYVHKPSAASPVTVVPSLTSFQFGERWVTLLMALGVAGLPPGRLLHLPDGGECLPPLIFMLRALRSAFLSPALPFGWEGVWPVVVPLPGFLVVVAAFVVLGSRGIMSSVVGTGARSSTARTTLVHVSYIGSVDPSTLRKTLLTASHLARPQSMARQTSRRGPRRRTTWKDAFFGVRVSKCWRFMM